MNHGLGDVVSRGGAALKENHLAVLGESEEIFEVSQSKLGLLCLQKYESVDKHK